MLTPMNGAARDGKPQEPESCREGVMQVPAPRTCTSVDTIDEQQAWASSLAGDGVAFGLIFDLHHQRVFRHVLRLTCDVHDSEDVVAAAFLELWRRRKDVPVVDGSVLPWLLVVANNLCLNRGRAMRRSIPPQLESMASCSAPCCSASSCPTSTQTSRRMV